MIFSHICIGGGVTGIESLISSINLLIVKLKSNNIILGAQNCSPYENYGPYTGSISAHMLKKAGAKYIILGHSENRNDGETPQIIKKKIPLGRGICFFRNTGYERNRCYKYFHDK